MTTNTIIKKNFSPLRYPGGKGKLCAYIKCVIEKNDLFDSEYVEPYAGGAAVAIELLAHEYVLSVHINDLSRPIYAFWNSVLNHTDDLCRLITKTRISVGNWDRQKAIFQDCDNHNDVELGFATFYLNRTNRSGILNAGIIGGRDQVSEWGIDARYNKKNLLDRIHMIAGFRDRITLTAIDAADLIRDYNKHWLRRAFIYFDPPYYNQGKHLYHNFYGPDDHALIAKRIAGLKKHRWIVSYDNHMAIRRLFKTYRSATYDIGYSARDHRDGKEVMFFSETLKIPAPIPNMKNFRLKRAA